MYSFLPPPSPLSTCLVWELSAYAAPGFWSSAALRRRAPRGGRSDRVGPVAYLVRSPEGFTTALHCFVVIAPSRDFSGFPDPWADPKSRSCLGLHNLHHRRLEPRIGGFILHYVILYRIPHYMIPYYTVQSLGDLFFGSSPESVFLLGLSPSSSTGSL